MEVKIKQGSELVDATIEMVDGVMVVSPKEKFEPKDGDVVTSGCFYEVNSIFKLQSNEIVYRSYISLYKGELHKDNSFMMKNIRPATEEEKQKLFDKMKEEGYEFDFEKKELVKLRWKPNEGEIYYYPSMRPQKGRIISYPKQERNTKTQFDKDIIDTGWVFRTEKECQAFCDRLNEVINSVKP